MTVDLLGNLRGSPQIEEALYRATRLAARMLDATALLAWPDGSGVAIWSVAGPTDAGVPEDVLTNCRTIIDSCAPALSSTEVVFCGVPVFVSDAPCGVLAAFAPAGRIWDNATIETLHDLAALVATITPPDVVSSLEGALIGQHDSLLEHAPIGFAFFDREYRYVHINEFLAEINGIPAAAHLGNSIVDLLPVNARTIVPIVDKVFASGEALETEITGETPAEPGVTRYWISGFYPVETASGERPLVGAFMIEITDRQQAEQGRLQLLVSEQILRAEAEAAVRLRDQMTMVIAHDLKSPLVAIKGQAQLLKRHVQRTSDASAIDRARLIRGLEQIDVAATRMSQQIGELLDAVRMQIGEELHLELAPTDLVALAREMTESYDLITQRHNITFSSSLPELVGDWDRARLGRALDNLLANAVKYSPDGGDITVRVALEPSAANGISFAMLSVRDSGIGIPDGELTHIFDWFRRAANVRSEISGTGIGLAIVKQVIEQHGGTVAVTSQEGVGTTFTILLPPQPPA